MKVLSLNIARNIHNFTLDGIEPDQLGGFVELASPLGTVRVKLGAEQIAAALEAVAVAVSGLATSMLTDVTPDAVAPALAIEHQPEAEAPTAGGSLRLEAGGIYLADDGRVAQIVGPGKDTPAGLLFESYMDGMNMSWYASGNFYASGEPHRDDLVREVNPAELGAEIEALTIPSKAGDDGLPF